MKQVALCLAASVFVVCGVHADITVDSRFDFAEAPHEVENGAVVHSLEPRSFALVEFR